MTLAERFHDIASGRRRGPIGALLRGGLWLASLGYGVGVRWRNRRLDRSGGTKVGVPVISVGNLSLGGTGKTPCVEYIARFFRERDIRVAILSRGYGASHGPNDEALVLEENLPDVPHLQGPDRVALAETAIEELESELLILDDGFQHRRLFRELDIVLVDATNPWGHGYLFPRGLLREPKSSLGRADAVILTKSGNVTDAELTQLRIQAHHLTKPGAPIVAADHQPITWRQENGSECDPRSFAGKPVVAFCGLGNPDSFLKSLGSLGVTPQFWRTFPDHHGYNREDVDELRRWASQLPNDGVVLTTQKDAVKLRINDLSGRPLWALRIGMTLRAGEETTRLEQMLANIETSIRREG